MSLNKESKKTEKAQIRFIAFYLPQFHPIPENDVWWGKGFTEWTNVAKAKPLFKNHIQPNIPADLGFYDLRLPETRIAQADIAYKHGIEGFCYWHYWFSGKRILERPFTEVLKSGKPDFPFCLAWANESWSGIWHGTPNKILIKQNYPGKQDYIDHAVSLLDAFADKRYIKVDNKPLFIIYKPLEIPDISTFIEVFQETAIKHGLPGLYICGFTDSIIFDPKQYYLDAIIYSGFNQIFFKKFYVQKNKFFINKLKNLFLHKLFDYPIRRYTYKIASKIWMNYPWFDYNYYPVVFPNWDNSPRTGKKGVIITESTPDLFRQHVQQAINRIADREAEKKIIFIKSWNEWAEGNYLEPDIRYGSKYLKIIKDL